jgi:hypothetical protein
MPRIKHTARVVHKVPSAAAFKQKTKALLTKAAKKSALAKGSIPDGFISTGKLKVAFKPANNITGASVAASKKALMKQLKRR